MKLREIGIKDNNSTIWIETNKEFPNIRELLTHLGCTVEDVDPTVTKFSLGKTAEMKFNVTFPPGSVVLKRAKEEDKRSNIFDNITKILVPGVGEDYVLTLHEGSRLSPAFFDRGVKIVEKE